MEGKIVRKKEWEVDQVAGTREKEIVNKEDREEKERKGEMIS